MVDFEQKEKKVKVLAFGISLVAQEGGGRPPEVCPAFKAPGFL